MTGRGRSEMLRPMKTAQSLREECTVLEPGEVGWDAARRAFNLAVEQRPALIALPLDERDVIAAVRIARERGLRVVAQCAGHRAERNGDLADAMLLRTTALAGVEIDVRAHRARVRAGARWADVADRASFLGLAPAGCFSRTAGVVGDILSDGMGWLARRHGVAARGVLAVEVVTWDGELVRVEGPVEQAPAGVITALELALHPAEDLYAGALFFSPERAAEVLHAWREWTATAPAQVTSVARMMRFPDRHDVPELVRGRAFTIIEAAHLGTDPAELLAPLRALRPGARHVLAGSALRPRAPAHGQRAPRGPAGRRRDRGRAAGRGDRRPRHRRQPPGLTARDGRAAPRQRRAGDARARVLHPRRRYPDRRGISRRDRAHLALVAGALAPYGAVAPQDDGPRRRGIPHLMPAPAR